MILFKNLIYPAEYAKIYGAKTVARAIGSALIRVLIHAKIQLKMTKINSSNIFFRAFKSNAKTRRMRKVNGNAPKNYPMTTIKTILKLANIKSWIVNSRNLAAKNSFPEKT